MLYVHGVLALLATFCWVVKCSSQSSIWVGSDEDISVSINIDTNTNTFGSIVALKKVISPGNYSPSLIEADCKTQPPLWQISVVTNFSKYLLTIESGALNLVFETK